MSFFKWFNNYILVFNYKSTKMKKLLLFTILFSANILLAQNMTYRVWEIKVKEQASGGLLNIWDSYFKDAEIQKNGTLLIQKFNQGTPRGMTHRVVWISEIGRTGHMREDSNEADRSLMRQKARNKFEFGTSFSGRILSSLPGGFTENPIVQIFHLKLKDPAAFKAAHDKFFESLGDYANGKRFGFGTIDVGSPDGATHWVAMHTSKKDGGLIQLHHDFSTKFGEQQMEWWKTNGGFEIVDDFSLINSRSYQ